MIFRIISFFLVMMISTTLTYGQEVPIVAYGLNNMGQVQLTVNSTVDHYYILKVKVAEDSNVKIPVSMTLGEADMTILSESLEAKAQIVPATVDLQETRPR